MKLLTRLPKRYHFSCGLDRKDACWLSFTPLTGFLDLILFSFSCLFLAFVCFWFVLALVAFWFVLAVWLLLAFVGFWFVLALWLLLSFLACVGFGKEESRKGRKDAKIE